MKHNPTENNNLHSFGSAASKNDLVRSVEDFFGFVSISFPIKNEELSIDLEGKSYRDNADYNLIAPTDTRLRTLAVQAVPSR